MTRRPVRKNPKKIWLEAWPATIRDLIKQENDLVTSRIGWMMTFQGILFTSYAFCWDKGIVLSFLGKGLCFLGILHAIISWWSLHNAQKAIKSLLKNWCKYLRDTSQKKEDLPPIWGWVSVEEKKRPFAPWLWLPLLLILAWFSIFLFVPIPLEPTWQVLAQDNLKQALSYGEPDGKTTKPTAITTLARIHGNANEGAKVFYDVCAGCHGAPKLYLMSANTADDLIKEDRNSVIVALVGANLHIRIFDACGANVIDKAEKNLSGENLETFKKKVNHLFLDKFYPSPVLLDKFYPSLEEEKEIIKDVISITRYTQPSDKHIPNFDEFFEKYSREDIVRGILYPNKHKDLKCMNIKGKKMTYMENDLITSISPKEFIDVVEYLKKSKPKWDTWPRIIKLIDPLQKPGKVVKNRCGRVSKDLRTAKRPQACQRCVAADFRGHAACPASARAEQNQTGTTSKALP